MATRINSYRELRVYQMAVDAAMRIFELSKRFPAEERYSLTDQFRRASRSVCTNTAEGWHKRRYKAAFIAKLSDGETEACESQVWTEFCRRCGYLNGQTCDELGDVYDHIIAQLVKMLDAPEKWLLANKSPVRPFADSPIRPSAPSPTREA